MSSRIRPSVDRSRRCAELSTSPPLSEAAEYMTHLTGRWLLKAQPTLIRALLRVLTIERSLSGGKDVQQGGSFVVPNDVRINSVSVSTVGGVKVHEMDV